MPDLLALADRELHRGDAVGEYVVEGKIGSGTFGDVYRAIQPLIAKQVAIKILSHKYSADPHVVSRFIAEARAVNQIRHKNIIDIFSFGQLPDGRHYHIMELLQGETLDAYLAERGRLAIGETIAILQPLARALDAAHAANIVHRDLKPANVFLSRDEDGAPFPKLLDFGIAKLLADEVPRQHQTATGAAVGTPDYMSPEQCQGHDVDHRTDVYAFGVMTYQLVTGRLPFVGNNVVEVLVKQIQETAAPPSSVSPEVPPAMDRAILSMLEKDKRARPQSLATAVRALEAAARSVGIEVPFQTITGDFVAQAPRSSTSKASDPKLVPASGESVLSDTLPSPPRSSAEPVEIAPPLAPRRASLTVAAIAVAVVVPAGALFAWLGSESRIETAPLAEPAPATRASANEPPDSGQPDSGQTDTAQTATTSRDSVRGADGRALIELRVRSTPSSVEIYAPGGVLLGTSPCSVHLARGTEPVKLEFRAAGWLPLTKEITPLADGAVDVVLEKKGAPKSLKKKPRSDDIEDPF